MGIDTADVDPERLPDNSDLNVGQDGKIQLGLYQAWSLLRDLDVEPCAAFMQEQGARMLDMLKVRNYSILAHGFSPISREEWSGMHRWMKQNIIPMLEILAREAGYRHPVDALQLPTEVPG